MEVEASTCAYGRLPGIYDSLLYAGSRFEGEQRSKGNKHDVEVVLHHVDLEHDFLCGYLKIKNLVEDFPVMTTFFEGEIIGDKHPFLTRKWEADEEVDKKHWSKFSSFHAYAKSFNSDDFDYQRVVLDNVVFMRWKEQFLVPDHTVTDIAGASFAGFYYICCQKTDSSIDGFYYHRNSEMFQTLKLRHVPQKSFSVYAFH
ncbi:glucose-induced degradation protein 4 homolog [Oscarella lobularis]|uniref:glucose-induced degradation protein 4 homolog n=1 Tax=Oscarella lobularis TaxID=121494 RepID=UPI00331380FE